MCGIYGFVGFKNDKLLKEMGKILSHRGPDDQDDYVEGEIGLGYRRLAVIDTKGSFQPLFNEDKTIVLFYNGEIYNFKTLRKKLKKHRFKTNGDGETLIHHYEQFGSKGFKDLNGIFGFALYQKAKNKLLLVRDHFGIKPLYYWQENRKLVFASEIKAILTALKTLKIKAQPNEEAIHRYLLKRVHDNDEQTFFEGIKRILPGSFLEYDTKTGLSRILKYWKLEVNPSLVKNTDQENIAQFQRLFRQAVDRQLMSEVPLGTALSGGLDSSSVVMTVNKLFLEQVSRIGPQDLKAVIGDRQKTFSAQFPGGINNEKEYIDEVVKASKVDSHVVIPTREEMWKEIDQVIYHQDEPMISTGPYAQWKVMELAAKNRIRVMLDGQGADELLAGYDPYFLVFFRELFLNGQFISLFKEFFLSLSVVWKYIWEKIEYATGIKTRLLPDDLFNFDSTYTQNLNQNNLNARLTQDLFEFSLPSLLRYEDKNSMAHSIESRVPFLDKDLVEFVASLPSNYKIRNGWNKWIMREALKDLLPKKISTRRRKIGFTTPEIAWMRESGREVRKILNSQSFNSRSYFRHQKIRDAFDDFVVGKNDESLIFWRIINLELWLRKFID